MTGMTIDLNDMYIEDSAISFDDLNDVPTEVEIEEASLGAEEVDAEDLYAEDELPEEVEEVEEDEEVEEVEEIEEVEEEEVLEEAEDEEVDFEEYDVTLPDGEVVKLHEAIRGYKDAQALQAERQAFEAEKANYEQSNTQVKKLLELAKLEAARVIEDYDGFDWATLSREDPQAYVENREFLDKYKARHKEIVAEMDFVNQKLEEESQAALATKAAAANQILSRDIPGWNKALYVDLMTYAVNELGMEEAFVTGSVDAGFFKAIHLAKEAATGKTAVKAKIKRINSAPKKVVKAAPKAQKVATTAKTQIQKRLEDGQYSQKDLNDAFSLLID